MKIAGESRLANLDAYLKGIRDKKRTDASSGKGSGEVSSKDQVVLSPEAKQIQKAKELIGGLPDIREEKVEAVRSRMQEGSYEIDGEKIASKIIEESLLRDLS
ncbi:MAG: flagellar biosynthesis anti-sigma factor FlgM [Desulfobacteraceae bacterium]